MSMSISELICVLENESPILLFILLLFALVIVLFLVVRPLLAIGDIANELFKIRKELEALRKGEKE